MYAYVPSPGSVLRINPSELFIAETDNIPNLRRHHVSHVFLHSDVFSDQISREMALFLRYRLVNIRHTKLIEDIAGRMLIIQFGNTFAASHVPLNYLSDRATLTYLPLINFAMLPQGYGSLRPIAEELLSMRSPFTLLTDLEADKQPTDGTQGNDS